MPLLQFAPFSAVVHPSFWHTLSQLKIDVLRLDDKPQSLRAYYSTGRTAKDRTTGEQVALACSLNADGDALDAKANLPANTCPSQGSLKNFNTIEEFKKADKQAIFDALADEIYEAFKTSPDPVSYITRFLVLTFADLKKYRFFYWFGFPAFISKPAWEVEVAESRTEIEGGLAGWKGIQELGPQKTAALQEAIASHRRALDAASADGAFFLVKPSSSSSSDWVVGKIVDYDVFFKDVPESECLVVFVDPSAQQNLPGWPLRNVLTLLNIRFGVRRARIVCWKDELSAADFGQGSRSTLAWVKLPEGAQENASQHARPQAVGWEKNAHGKLGPKMADLAPMMDPKRLADQAVDLNLKLMRWRILPSLDLEKVQSAKCLLLGAGTLGCYVARTLMGWGVRQITFVDSARVSFSNPVRQPLFEFEDCLEGGKLKAACAAERLKKVYPGVNATGHHLSIPMPGHPVPEVSVAQTEKDVQKLEQLVDEHDVVYLLMDSRESRWLPSLLGAAKGKLVMDAALGFDTYLVMRHGASPDGQIDEDQMKKPPAERRLGCYFCNDVVAPTDSLTDRTLDQMCTVTRPGLAALAGASAVELMVSVLQHPKGVAAPASSSPNEAAPSATAYKDSSSGATSGSVLGLVPHQIRGYLSQFSNMLVTGQAFSQCTACSSRVVDEYRAAGFSMLLNAFNDDGYLERLTGLDKLREEGEKMMENLDWEEEEEEGEGEGELL